MAEKYSKALRGYFTESEYREIMVWMEQKKRFSRPSYLIRFAVYSIIGKDRAGAHHTTTGRPVGRPKAENPEAEKRRHEATGRPVGRPHAKIAGNSGADQRPYLQSNSEQGVPA